MQPPSRRPGASKALIELTIHAVSACARFVSVGGEGDGDDVKLHPGFDVRRLWPCIATSAPILHFSLSTARKEGMCQHVPFASVAMPPLFIALRVVLVDAIFAS